jgi:hypothetical protein
MCLQVYVDPSRWRAMMCYDDWPVDVKARRLTKDPARAAAGPATLWVAPMGQINAKGLRGLLARANGGRGMQAEEGEEGAPASADIDDTNPGYGDGAEVAGATSTAQPSISSSGFPPRARANLTGKTTNSTKATATSGDRMPFHRVVAFQPTGWSQGERRGGPVEDAIFWSISANKNLTDALYMSIRFTQFRVRALRASRVRPICQHR